jgi:hypothetical protein
LANTGPIPAANWGAIVRAGLGGVVYGSSISALAEAGIAQIMMSATCLSF